MSNHENGYEIIEYNFENISYECTGSQGGNQLVTKRLKMRSQLSHVLVTNLNTIL